jgi:hypothetical protein
MRSWFWRGTANRILAKRNDYVLDSEQREALEPAISRYERDRFLDAYYSLFGPLDHFVRTTEQPRQGT